MIAGTRPACDGLPTVELVTGAREGDQGAWDALVERYAPLVWSVCRRNWLSDEDAADVAQGVWLALAEQLDAIRDPAALAGWLATTTRRECGRAARAARRAPAVGYLPDIANVPDGPDGGVEREVLAAERQAALREALASLPAGCRELLALLTEDPPVPYAQISARLRIPVGSIGPRRARCLARLRRHPAIAALVRADTGHVN